MLTTTTERNDVPYVGNVDLDVDVDVEGTEVRRRWTKRPFPWRKSKGTTTTWTTDRI